MITDLRILLLGLPRIERDGTPIELERRKALALLAYLTFTRQTQSREWLADFLWPENEPSRAFAYLRTTLWTINKTLGDEWLEIERETIGVRSDAPLWVDAAVFRQQMAAAVSVETRQSAVLLAQAVDLYRGDFLTGLTLWDAAAFEEWQTIQRETLRLDAARALERLVAAYLSLGEYEVALPYAHRWLALDALHEPAHRALMRLYAHTGQRTAALRQYRECAGLLNAELGVTPDAETMALFEAIQQNRLTPTSLAVPLPTPALEVASNLPSQTTMFVGREREQADIRRLLGDPACRLLTLSGPGGIGKTRMAVQVAGKVASEFRHGVHFVSLAPITSGEFLIPAIAEALRFTAYSSGDPKQLLLYYLGEKALLLVLDNFEHLLDEAALLVDILASAPHVKILTTSRSRLRLHGEWVYEIQGMGFPHDGALENLDSYDAVRLFVQAARRVRPDFELTPQDAPFVSRICQLVEGMPLGVELAAAWLSMLTVGEIVSEIENCVDFLSSSPRDLPPRHQSLRAVFVSSWERLTPEEQFVLSRLSVFRGGCTREAASAVTGASMPVLLSLMDKSLLRRSSSGRFDMHELLRQFAEEKLGQRADAEVYVRHSRYYADYLSKREARLKGIGQIEALNEIEAEIDNLRIAWRHINARRDLTMMRQMLVSLSMFYEMRSRYYEGRDMLEEAENQFRINGAGSDEEQLLFAQIALMRANFQSRIERFDGVRTLYQQTAAAFDRGGSIDPSYAAEREADPLYFNTLAAMMRRKPQLTSETGKWLQRAMALSEAQNDRWSVAMTCRILGDIAHDNLVNYEESRALYERSLAICREIGDRWGESSSLQGLAEVAFSRGDYREAERLYREGLALSEAVGDRNTLAWQLDRLSINLTAQGHYDEAHALDSQAMAIAREVGNIWQASWCNFNLGTNALAAGDLQTADAFFDENIRQSGVIIGRLGGAWSRAHQSRVALVRGDYARAKRLAHEALDQMHEVGNRWGQAAAAYHLGEALIALGEYDEAQRLLRHSVRLAHEMHSVIQVLRHLVGLARLLASLGETVRAVEVLGFVIGHPASWQETKDWAKRLLNDLTAELPASTVEKALKRGEALTIDVVIQEFVD